MESTKRGKIRLKNFTLLIFVLLFAACMASADVAFYTDATLFDALYPGLTVEDYSGTIVPPDGVQPAPGPFNSLTNNACFTPGAIVDGITLDNLEGNNNVVLTPPYLGVTSVTVGPNNLTDNGEFSFTVPVNAFGVEIVMPMATGSVYIEVFGTGGSLGTTSSAGTLAGVFWGVYSDEEIVRIEFIEPVTTGELFANARFGAALALENSTWGSIKTVF